VGFYPTLVLFFFFFFFFFFGTCKQADFKREFEEGRKMKKKERKKCLRFSFFFC
jgi:hypothetical protein